MAVTRTSNLKIERLNAGRATFQHWLAAKHAAHAGHEAYVAPLPLFEKRRLTPKHNAFFDLGDAEFFVAFRYGRPVGRISAQIHRPGLANAPPDLAHFGFFDVTEDADAARALLDAAIDWVRMRGATRLRGPFSLSINEETGCQIDDFDTPTSYLMPQARPWTGQFLESNGLAKCMDVHTWRVSGERAQKYLARFDSVGRSMSTVEARNIRMNRFEEEIELFADIFNDAWSDNWGFVPFSPRAVKLMAANLKVIYRASYGAFAEVDGKPVGVFISMPNLNELIKPLNGGMNPFGLARLGWGLWREQAETLRVPLAGLRKTHQSGLQGPLIIASMLRLITGEAKRRPKRHYEFSWILETNRSAISAMKAIGATRTTTHRVYERAI
jgi:GNAT superfamily N-acetyltransferase